MIHIAIVEDENKDRELLKEYLDRFQAEKGEPLFVHVYPDGEEFLESFSSGKFDILLLDIHMQYMNGMATAQEIRKSDDNVLIIFITNLVQYAVQGYSVRAFDFIVKPVEYSVFAQKLYRATQRLNRTIHSCVRFKVLDQIVNLQLSGILYFEIVARKLFIHTDTEIYRCNDTLHSIEEKLNDGRFFRCHAGYLVNVAYVRSVGKDYAMVGSARIPVSKHRRKAFLDAIGNYLGSKI